MRREGGREGERERGGKEGVQREEGGSEGVMEGNEKREREGWQDREKELSLQ